MALRMMSGERDIKNEVFLIEREKAINTGPPSSRKEQERQYYEEQPAPQGELTMEKSGVSKMLVVSGALAAVAGGYYGVKFYKSRQEGLIRDFAYSMMLYWVSEMPTYSYQKSLLEGQFISLRAT